VRHRDADSLQTLVERYLVFVHSSALRRTGDAAQAAEVTRAVFLVLARRARRLRKKTVLAGWLFHITAIACRKLRQKRMGRLGRLWQWISRKPRPALLPDATLWTRLAPPNGSRAGTIAIETAERSAAVRISESRFCFRGESSSHE